MEKELIKNKEAVLSIWKFPFTVSSTVTFEIPRDHRFIHVDMQGNQPCLWAVVDPGSSLTITNLRIYGTGHPIVNGEAGSFIGTFQQPPFVWHVFKGK